MTTEQRKMEIRRRLRLAKYPRRSHAVFSEENDHNPIVLQDCATCHGTGKVCRHFKTKEGGECIARDECPSCAGQGVTGELEPYFSNDQPERPADCRSEGRVQCPSCSRRFRITDPNAWTGKRHMRCGQKIKLNFVEES
jgi:DnaJ-class molecular chaperone